MKRTARHYAPNAQPSMFPCGEDLPLFSGTAQPASIDAYRPAPVARQDTMFDMRPTFNAPAGTLEPVTAKPARIRATYDAAGNCHTCGEAGRCPGWHTLSEVKAEQDRQAQQPGSGIIRTEDHTSYWRNDPRFPIAGYRLTMSTGRHWRIQQNWGADGPERGYYIGRYFTDEMWSAGKDRYQSFSEARAAVIRADATYTTPANAAQSAISKTETAPAAELVLCHACGAVMEPEGRLDATGITNHCSECGAELSPAAVAQKIARAMSPHGRACTAADMAGTQNSAARARIMGIIAGQKLQPRQCTPAALHRALLRYMHIEPSTQAAEDAAVLRWIDAHRPPA